MSYLVIVTEMNTNTPLTQEFDFACFISRCQRLQIILIFMILSHLEFGLPCGSAGKESTYNVGDLGLIPGLGRSPGEG